MKNIKSINKQGNKNYFSENKAYTCLIYERDT